MTALSIQPSRPVALQPAVLHVPYTWRPDAIGGAEIYVDGLARRLNQSDFRNAIAAPARASARYDDQGLAISRFAIDPVQNIEHAYGKPDATAAQEFRGVLANLRPDIVHLHARTSAVSELLVDAAHDIGARVVLTYHTPTVTCARGAMMRFGREVCDGAMERRRCAECTLEGLTASRLGAGLIVNMPRRISRSAAKCAKAARIAGAFAIPEFIAAAHEGTRRLLHKVEHIVAVCDWAQAALLQNGVAFEKLTLSRQGVGGPAAALAPGARSDNHPLRIAYFGRLAVTKGPDLLALALREIPRAKVTVDIYGVEQGLHDPTATVLTDCARRDSRLRLLAPIAADQVVSVMAQYDLVAIPSRGLETGPLVALEAFAAGVPVLGARLGGIAEIVTDRVDGILVQPNAPKAWAAAIELLSEHPLSLLALRSAIKPPRTMRDCAGDMAALYWRLLAK